MVMDDMLSGWRVAEDIGSSHDDLAWQSNGLEGEAVGSWQVIELLDTGGVAEVYRAEHLYLQRQGALKVLLPAQAQHEEVLERFQREAHSISLLQHPNIVEIFEYNIDETYGPYMVLELLHGKPLSHVIQRGQTSLLWWTSVCQQICDALQAIHDKGMVHRDLKPANVFLLSESPDIQIKLLDFGCSKSWLPNMQGDLTSAGHVIGTPAYLAPEQMQAAQHIGPATDIYALGVFLFQALTGQLPFQSDTLLEHLYKVTHEQPPLLGSIQPMFSGTLLEALLSQMMARSSEERPDSMQDVWKSFQRAVQQLEPLADMHSVLSNSKASPTRVLQPLASQTPDTSQTPEPSIASLVQGPSFDSGSLAPALQPEPTSQTRQRMGLWLVLGILVVGAMVTFFSLPWQPGFKPQKTTLQTDLSVPSLDAFRIQGTQPNIANMPATAPRKRSAPARPSQPPMPRRASAPRIRTVLSLLTRANRALRRKQWRQALKHYQAYLRKYPRSSQRGTIQVRMKACRCALLEPLPWESCP